MFESVLGRMRPRTSERDGVTYTIRQYRDEDRTSLLSLYQNVLDRGMTSSWFRWKFEDNPYVTEVPVVVATRNGDVVGAAGFWPLALATGSGTVRVVQSCDGAVAPKHRRRGVYTEIFQYGLEFAETLGAQFVFDFPNEASKSTFEKYGWRLVDNRSHYYRVQSPLALLEKRYDVPDVPYLRSGLSRLAQTVLSHGASRSSRGEETITVERHADVPAVTCEALYRRTPPNRLHLLRDETFYEWRFHNPQWEYTTYVARRRGEPVAGVIVGRQETDGVTTAALTEVLPLAGEGQHRSLAPLVRAILADHHGADLVVAPPEAIPDRVAATFGFRDNRSFPLSLITRPIYMGVCSLRAGEHDEWVLDGQRLTDADAWRITFAEYDTR